MLSPEQSLLVRLGFAALTAGVLTFEPVKASQDSISYQPVETPKCTEPTAKLNLRRIGRRQVAALVNIKPAEISTKGVRCRIMDAELVLTDGTLTKKHKLAVAEEAYSLRSRVEDSFYKKGIYFATLKVKTGPRAPQQVLEVGKRIRVH